MPDFATGIDDIATMNAQCSGWTVVSIDYSLLEDFNQKAAQILKEGSLSSFHGKEFKRRKFDSYVEFITLIRSTLESSSGFACCTLLGQGWKSQFQGFCDNLIEQSFANVGIESEEIIEASKRIATPLIIYQRLASEKCQGRSTLIHIDRHSVLDPFNNAELLIDGEKISTQLPIIAAMRAHGRKMFPSAPEIERESILICPDEKSFLVQAADIIGNFSTAFSFRKLGKKSNSNDLKCAAFEQAFGNMINESTFPDSVILVGNDLALQGDGAAFTFCIDGTSA